MPRSTTSLLLIFLLAGCSGGTKAPPSAGAPAASPVPHAATPTLASSEGSGVIQASATAPASSSRTQLNYDQALELAEQLIQKQDLNNALRVLTGAIQVQPRTAEAYVKRAAVLANSHLYTPAIADITSAIQLQPENAKYYNTRGYFHLLKEDYDPAARDFADSIARDPNYPEPHNNLGLVHIGRKKFDQAVQEFDAALKIKPLYSDAQNNLGFTLLQQGKINESIVQFSQAIAANDKYLNAINNRGRAYLKAERYEESVADYTRAMELQPQNLQFQLQRAEAYKAWGKAVEAQADIDHVAWIQRRDEFNRLLSADNGNVELWVGFGRHLAQQQHWEDALKCYDQALKLSPGHSQAHVGRGLLFMTQNNLDQAIKDFTLALLKEPLLEAYSMRGDCHLKNGHLDGAIADYEMAKRIDSQTVQAYRQRSEKYAAEGEQELAKVDADRAAALQVAIADRESAARDSTAPRAALTEEQASALQQAEGVPAASADPQ